MLLPILDFSFSQLCSSCCVCHMLERHDGRNHVAGFWWEPWQHIALICETLWTINKFSWKYSMHQMTRWPRTAGGLSSSIIPPRWPDLDTRICALTYIYLPPSWSQLWVAFQRILKRLLTFVQSLLAFFKVIFYFNCHEAKEICSCSHELMKSSVCVCVCVTSCLL